MRDNEIFERYIRERGYKAVPCKHRPEERCYTDEGDKFYTPSDIKMSAHYWGFFHGLKKYMGKSLNYSGDSLRLYSSGKSLAMKVRDSQRVQKIIARERIGKKL